MSLATSRQKNGSLQPAYAVSVGATATLIVAGERLGVSIWNNSSQTVYLGDSGVTTTTGFPIAAGTGFTDSLTSSPIYGIVASSTADCRVLAVVP